MNNNLLHVYFQSEFKEFEKSGIVNNSLNMYKRSIDWQKPMEKRACTSVHTSRKRVKASETSE